MRITPSAPLLLLVAFVAQAQIAQNKEPVKQPAIREPDLREELLAMEKEDVDMRNGVIKDLSAKGIPYGGSRTISDPAMVKALLEPTRKMHYMDQKHRTRLKEIVKKYGWPGKSLVGQDGAHAAWLLAQHADRDLAFQKRALKLMKAAPKGEVELQDIAYLTDCLLIAEKRKQCYGTQLMVKGGTFKPRPIEDEAHVDKRRAEMGMPALADYLETAQVEYDRAAGKKK
jgi:hypothetical protein